MLVSVISFYLIDYNTENASIPGFLSWLLLVTLRALQTYMPQRVREDEQLGSPFSGRWLPIAKHKMYGEECSRMGRVQESIQWEVFSQVLHKHH